MNGNTGIGTEAALFPEKEYIMEISFAVEYRSICTEAEFLDEIQAKGGKLLSQLHPRIRPQGTFILESPY
jgi:hypothetical protein